MHTYKFITKVLYKDNSKWVILKVFLTSLNSEIHQSAYLLEIFKNILMTFLFLVIVIQKIRYISVP